MNTIAAIAVALGKALEPAFGDYGRQVLANAQQLAARLLGEGLALVTGGTDNHMMVVDTVTSLGIDGKLAEEVLDRIGITTNKQIIPDDPRPPLRPSGIRLGTPAATTRGMKEAEMETIGRLISRALKGVEQEPELQAVRREVGRLCERFPLYAARLQAYDRALAHA